MEPVPARPVTAMFLGLIVGLGAAVILQQGGVWPMDKITTFLLPGLLGLVFVLLSRVRRPISAIPLAIALILLIAPVAYGLTGIGEARERGQLNGDCTVEAASDRDTTVVTDTSRSNPFDIDPEGGLSWFATSPGLITDHEWEIWVVIGEYELVVADGGEANKDMTTSNMGDVSDVQGYVEGLGFRSADQIQGIYEVGGFIDGEGGSCDGFGFVKIEAGFFGSIASWIALVLGLIALGIFGIVAFTERFRALPAGHDTRDHVVVGATSEGRPALEGGDVEPTETDADQPGDPQGDRDIRPRNDRSD